MTDLVQRLNEPEEYYPGNFDTVKRANAMLLCLCQEAADALTVKDKEIAELRAERSEAIAVFPKLIEQAKDKTGGCIVCGFIPEKAALLFADYIKYKALCDQMGAEMKAAIPSLEIHFDSYFEALAAWRSNK